MDAIWSILLAGTFLAASQGAPVLKFIEGESLAGFPSNRFILTQAGTGNHQTLCLSAAGTNIKAYGQERLGDVIAIATTEGEKTLAVDWRGPGRLEKMPRYRAPIPHLDQALRAVFTHPKLSRWLQLNFEASVLQVQEGYDITLQNIKERRPGSSEHITLSRDYKVARIYGGW